MSDARGGGHAAQNNRANQLNPNNAAFASSRASTRAAANNRSNQLNPNNAAFWSSQKGAVAGDALDASHYFTGMNASVTLILPRGMFTSIPAPTFAVGYALHGNVESGIAMATAQHPLLIIFVRKTPMHDTCRSAFSDVREKYPTLKWEELSGVNNGTMAGEPPPYWCMCLKHNEMGDLKLDTGCGFDSLDGVVDGLVRAPGSKAPCGLNAPQPQCPDCKRPMKIGTASSETYGRLDAPLRWQAPDRRTQGERDMRIQEPPLLPIRTYRCPTCGLLRDYAFAHADWNAWDKEEKERGRE